MSSEASGTNEAPIAQRLARSGIVLPAADIEHLLGAARALDSARVAVTAAARRVRAEEDRAWALPASR